MRFVQSYWSKPLHDVAHRHNWTFRHQGGFPAAYFFYAAWMYSCLSISKYYPNLHLVTDSEGLRIFRDVLGLPYQSFSDALNRLQHYPKSLWALGKMEAYRLQNEPFCHIDGDVFLFGPVLDPVLEAPLFFQSYDYNGQQYAEIHPYVQERFEQVPRAFDARLASRRKYYNVGVIGGQDLNLYRDYTQAAFALIDHNLDRLHDLRNSGLFNLYYEQFLLSSMIDDRGLEARTLYPEPDEANRYNFAAWHQIPQGSSYVHLVSHLKKSTEFLEQLIARLQTEYPVYYTRLQDWAKQEGGL